MDKISYFLHWIMILIFLNFIKKPPHVREAINFIRCLGVSTQG